MDWMHIQMQAESVKTPLPLDILVPDRLQKGPYKAVYLLHDIAGNNTSWMRHTDIENRLADAGAVLIMPSCLNSFYVNMYYGYDMLDFITQELVSVCEGWLSLDARREARLIAGIGMGGYGAVRAALAAPQVFGTAVSLDGLLDPGRFYQEKLPAVSMEDVLGPEGFYRRSPNDVLFAARGLAHDPQTKARPEIVLISSPQDAFAAEAAELETVLTELGMPVCLYQDAEDGLDILTEKVRAM